MNIDSGETTNERRRCLICWELHEPSAFPADSFYGKNEYCTTCHAIQRAQTKAHLEAMFDLDDTLAPYLFVLDGIQFGERWQEYIVEYLYGSIFYAFTQRYIFTPERYRGSTAPLLNDGVTPLVWRIRLFHTMHKGYAEGWWNPQTRQWDWSLNRIDPDMPAAVWSEWRAAVREAAGAGRPRGSALVYLSSVSAFLARCREAVSTDGWPEAAKGMDPIAQKQTLRRVREGTVTQAQLGEILGCGHRTVTLALARFKENDRLDWRDLQRWLADWSRES